MPEHALWEIAVTNRLCVLVTGPRVATGAFLGKHGIELPWRVIHVTCDRPAALWKWEMAGTVVLHDVDRLSLRWQSELFGWLDTEAGRTQVVSTTSRSLLPLIAAGDFLEQLFYRLNTVHITLPDRGQKLRR
jgi:hypothetical protein